MSALKDLTEKHLKGDPIIWGVVFMLSIVSILVVYSATGTLAFKRMINPETYLLKHSLLICLALFSMWLSHKIDYRYYSKISRLLLWISVPILIFTYYYGISINDASRWIQIPLIKASFQPSDLASLALITNTASMLSKKQENISNFKFSVMPIIIWCGVICTLIALTNLSSAILLFVTCMLLFFIGRVPLKYILLMLSVGIIIGFIAINFGERGETAKNRIETFLDSNNLSFQAKHARIAIATGGLFGKGPGNSQQRNLLPYPYSDFVYAIIIEEYGMIGGIIVLILYLVLLLRGMKTVTESQNAFGGLLSAGLSFALVLQAMVNMSVVVGLGPITGLTLPLISMGGTSLLFVGISIGIILSVSRGQTDTSWESENQERNNILKPV